MMEYKEEDFLLLSGIQHFSFCKRQWALIYIEQQWQENLRTIEGEILHEKTHDDSIKEKRGKPKEDESDVMQISATPCVLRKCCYVKFQKPFCSMGKLSVGLRSYLVMSYANV